MPPGDKSYMGQAPALLGESEIRGQSTGVDILTITAPSTMDGDYLVLRSNVSVGSTRTDTELFAVSSAGGLTMSGALTLGPTTTAQFLVSTAGAIQNFRFLTTTLSATANSTAVTLGSSQSGRVVIYGGWASAAAITLPAPADGLSYLLYCKAKNVGAVTIKPTATAARIHAAASTGSDSINLSTAIELNAWTWLISDGTEWYSMTVRDGSSVGFPSTTINSTAAAGVVTNLAVANS